MQLRFSVRCPYSRLNWSYNACTVDASSATTLRREMLDAIQQKLSSLDPVDDFEWPLISSEGTPEPRDPESTTRPRMLLSCSEDEVEVGNGNPNERSLKDYWRSVQSRYQAKLLDPESLRSSQTKTLPSNWTNIRSLRQPSFPTLLVGYSTMEGLPQLPQH